VCETLSEAQHLVRLACVRHAASVRPEPGSNSRLNGILTELLWLNLKTSFVLVFVKTEFTFCLSYQQKIDGNQQAIKKKNNSSI